VAFVGIRAHNLASVGALKAQIPTALKCWLVLEVLALEALDVLALAFRKKSFNPFMVLPFRSKADYM